MSPNPVLPVPGERNILITSALPYVNNVPHLGNIIGCVLSADVFARYCRLRGYNVLYVCGTDEYGTATETKAIQEGVSPKEICDKYFALHKQVYEWFDIQFDIFGRTTTDLQTQICQDIFLRLHERGFTSEQAVEQLYCEKCERFLADRFVEGVCPKCSYDDARGDQCDGCGNLMNPIELIKPRCKLCNQHPIVKQSNHIFLSLPEIQGDLENWINKTSVEGHWSENSTQITQSWIRDGLRSRCITRDLKWGTPVPVKGFENKVFYVWFDAPIGYLSITACYTDKWELWWKNPENVKLYQFMGKDNVPFHCVIFPSTLIATGQPWTLLHHISTTEYLNYEHTKFSKSRAIGVFGSDVLDLGIRPDVWRYYLLANRPETADSDFSWTDFEAKNNNELLANFGNFCLRALKFVVSHFGSKVPPLHTLSEEETKLTEKINESIKEYLANLELSKLKEPLKTCMHISSLANKYLQDSQPWVLVKTNPERAETVINYATNLVKLLATLFFPYLPGACTDLFRQLKIDTPPSFKGDKFVLEVPEGHQIGDPQPLFKKYEKEETKGWQKKFSGTQQQQVALTKFPLDLRVGKITSVTNHPEGDTLYVINVDVGESAPRQVVAGLRTVYKIEDLTDKQVIIVCNLKATKFKGQLSQGMLLAANASNSELKLLSLTSSDPISLGSRVVPQNTDLAVITNMDHKKHFQKLVLKTDEQGRPCFYVDDVAHVFQISGKECFEPTFPKAIIK